MNIEIPKDSVLNRIVPAHKKVSREVTEKDIDRVIEEVRVLHAICFEKVGIYRGAYAMAHPQIDDKDPLRLFVTVDKKIIINPVITNKTKYQVDSREGCVTYAEEQMITV